jgi:membrane-anchored mycosin MYCP
MRPTIPAALAAALAAVAALALAPAAALAAPAGPTDQCLAGSATVSHAVPWAQQELQPAMAWNFTQGAGQVVAVLDSGVSATAPALAGAVLPGLNAVTGGPGDRDCTGDGTFVAGIIAARPAPGGSFAGLAPEASILPVDVTGANGSVTPGAVAAGLRFAVEHGATVVDLSTSATPGPSAALEAAVADATARNVVVIAPVGTSETTQADQVSYPAAYPGVVAVAAVDSSGAPVAAAGPGVRVDLAAPGSQVSSIGPRGPGLLIGSGAGLATAFVAGTVALVRSYYPQLSAAQVVHRLEVTADQPGTALPNPQVGYGTVDPYTAVTTVLPEESGALPPSAAASPPPRLLRSAPAGTWPGNAALIASAAVAVGIAVALSAAATIRSGRRRHWRPPPDRSTRHAPVRQLGTGPGGQNR